MTEIFPDYYHEFVCIAHKCRHSCCIGWDIDIDEDTMTLYNSLDSTLGEKIRANIDGDVPHFILRDNGRCPFLNENGLCDIICECGEDALCDICFLHPRFKNFYSSFTETGLGVCCEEAARIILSQEEKFSIKIPEGTGVIPKERKFFKKRDEIFGILQNREQSINKCFSNLAERFGFKFEFSIEELLEVYSSLERLDCLWTNELDKLKSFVFDKSIFDNKDFQIPFEQLGVYFIFRHLANALADGDYTSVVKFTLVSCYFIGALCQRCKSEKGSISFNELCEFVRMYSSEIEYSNANLETIKNIGGNASR